MADRGSDPLYELAVEELARLNARVMEREVRRRVALEIEARDLVPRSAEDQPSSETYMRALYRAFDQKMREPNAGTFAGGAIIVKDVAMALGVEGAAGLPYLRRTRAQVEAAPNPSRRPEGRGRRRTIHRLDQQGRSDREAG